MKKIHLILMGMLALVALTAASCNGSANITADTNTETESTADTSSEGDTSATTEAAETVTIEYTDSGFSPANVTINKGDTVRFVNKSSSAFWPASGPHPTHTALPSLNANRNIAVGGSYDYKFETAGSWGYHNHLKPTDVGKVTVN